MLPSPAAPPGPPPRHKHRSTAHSQPSSLEGFPFFPGSGQCPAVALPGTLALPLTQCPEPAGAGFVPWMDSSVKPLGLQYWGSLGKAGMGCSCWKSPSKCHKHHNSQCQNAALTLSPSPAPTGIPQPQHSSKLRTSPASAPSSAQTSCNEFCISRQKSGPLRLDF